MKKIISLIMVLLVVTALTGCESKKSFKKSINKKVERGILSTGLSSGDAVYFNPETKEECNEEDSVSGKETKTGCMKWYVYKTNDDGTYKLILAHNTTAKVAWISKEDYIAAGGTEEDWGKYKKNIKGPITVMNQLKADTATWDESLNAELITADEVAHIVGADREDTLKWKSTKPFKAYNANPGPDPETEISRFYFGGMKSNNPTSYSEDGWIQNAKGEISEYAWLYDYTRYCVGCNIDDISTAGYWTSTPTVGKNVSHAWSVGAAGNLSAESSSANRTFGIRPVITV